mgnify:CR=1 FL=1
MLGGIRKKYTDRLVSVLSITTFVTITVNIGVAASLIYNFSRLDASDAREMMTSQASGRKAANSTG